MAKNKNKNGDTIRICFHCKKEIIIDRQNLNNIVQYNNKYYHEDCFVGMCQDKIASGKRMAYWKEKLDETSSFKLSARNTLELCINRDDFNEYLLKHYNVTAIQPSFWSIVSDIGNGFYKGKNCNAIDIQTIHNVWKWGQNKLDKINVTNKMNHRGPSNDNQRLMYDLAIVISKVPNYLEYKSKMNVLEAQANKPMEKQKINYNNIEVVNKNNSNKLDNITDLLDEIF